MKVPKGKTFYIGKKKLKAGTEVPAVLESKFAKYLDKPEGLNSYKSNKPNSDKPENKQNEKDKK